MFVEVSIAVNFIANYLRSSLHAVFSELQLSMFETALVWELMAFYHLQWFPNDPKRHSESRCFRIGGAFKSILSNACFASGLDPDVVFQFYPEELSITIDPGFVAVSYGGGGRDEEPLLRQMLYNIHGCLS